MGCLLEITIFLIESIAEFVFHIVLALTWPGLLLGIAVATVVLLLPTDGTNLPWAIAAFLIAWLGTTVALTIRRSRMRAKELRDHISL